MARGISLHVGINQPSSAFPNAAPLKNCENDALAMERIAALNNFKTRDLLLGSDATYARVTTKIRSAATELEAGDIFLFTFAGHGFQESDVSQDEDDFLDETLLLFDVELFDDVLRKDLWPRFRPNVRVLMIADSCHSGTVATVPPPPDDDEFTVAPANSFVPRTISQATSRHHQEEYGEFYRNLLVPIFNPPILASVLQLGACEDNQTTGDGVVNGEYTAAMLKVLQDPTVATYDALVDGIQTELSNAGRDQIPTITPVGADDQEFRSQKPFTV